MGLGFGFSSSSCACDSQPRKVAPTNSNPQRLPNPNPSNYIIKETVAVGDLTMVVVNYPDCTNYEGNKILVFDAPLNEVLYMGVMDPHFCDGDHLSPIARFVPTHEGRRMAITVMNDIYRRRTR